ncbi:MAG: hypothetical protein IT324_16220 [Anaerolineae bacterium]|nr:hypothetical protein [Anaerolineae bacterium]
MSVPNPWQDIGQEVRTTQPGKGDFPVARWSSLVGGLVLGAAGLRKGGIPGAIMAMLGGTLLRRGTRTVDLDRVPEPSGKPWWKRFTRRQAAIAKSEPLTPQPSDPRSTG